MPVKDYNADPDLNTQISGINIAEGCAPSGINNAIRQLMADVKEEFEGEEGTVSSLRALIAEEDSALRTLIAEKVAKYLPLTGGLISGAIILAGDNQLFVRRNNDDGSIVIRGGTDNTSAQMTIGGKNHPDAPGRVTLQAIAGDASNILLIDPDGTSTVNGKNIVRSVNNYNANSTGNVTLPTGWISEQAMPSSKYTTLSLAASNTQYTAPANGYFVLQKSSTYTGEYLTLYNRTAASLGSSRVSYGAVTSTVFIPAKKGDKVAAVYSYSGTTGYFRFVCAEGDNA